jgi:hypothetical protein
MHRNPILSRITHTKPNELGGDFWVRILSFGTVPVLTWMAYQFPSIGNTIYKLIQPGADVVREMANFIDFIARGRRGIAQPAIKCRGPEYLRIIYGPEYLLPENLERLRSRNVGAKRLLASRELALGIEALERFVRKEPLRRVHECVFGVLALES